MTSLESRVNDVNMTLPVSQDDASCPEATEVSDQLSIAVPPDPEIECLNPVNPDNSHGVALLP